MERSLGIIDQRKTSLLNREFIVKDFLKTSLCASLDVLGFQDEINRAYREKQEEILLGEIEDILKSAADDLEDLHIRNPEVLTTLKFFTDNVVVGYHFMPPISKIQLCCFCELISDFQLSMACKGFFIRGGISIGTLASDERIVFGDCLVKAHELEAQVAGNPRVILDLRLSNQSSSDLTFSNFRLMRDVDGYLFVNYLSALLQIELDPRPGPRINEARLKVHKDQVEHRLQEKRHDPKVWNKYLWVANYHDAFCDRFQMKQYKINESLLRAQPVSL